MKSLRSTSQTIRANIYSSVRLKPDATSGSVRRRRHRPRHHVAVQSPERLRPIHGIDHPAVPQEDGPIEQAFGEVEIVRRENDDRAARRAAPASGALSAPAEASSSPVNGSSRSSSRGR